MVPTADPLAASFGIAAEPVPDLTEEAWSRMLQLATAAPRAAAIAELVPGARHRPDTPAASDM